MQVIAKSSLKAFWERHPQAQEPLLMWHKAVSKAAWQSPADVKLMFGAKVISSPITELSSTLLAINTAWSCMSLIPTGVC